MKGIAMAFGIIAFIALVVILVVLIRTENKQKANDVDREAATVANISKQFPGIEIELNREPKPTVPAQYSVTYTDRKGKTRITQAHQVYRWFNCRIDGRFGSAASAALGSWVNSDGLGTHFEAKEWGILYITENDIGLIGDFEAADETEVRCFLSRDTCEQDITNAIIRIRGMRNQ